MTDPLIETPTLILAPVFNDWQAAAAVLEDLDVELARAGRRAEVVLVNDGSTERPDPALFRFERRAIARIWRLDLRRNLGHQRAIAVGLTHLYSCAKFGALVVMDSDGEDRPSDVPRLLQRFEELRGERVVFAQRTKRTESLAFRTLYFLYRHAHRVLTGVRVRVGNFSVLPPKAVSTLVVVSELWNHYAAAVFKARIPHALLPAPRGVRASGHSKMNFVALVVHGLSAISVFGDTVGVRLIIAAGALVVALLGLLACAIAGLLPGWTVTASVLLLVLAAQVATLSLYFVFGALSGRAGSAFIPERDCGLYIAGFEEVGMGATARRVSGEGVTYSADAPSEAQA